MRLNMVAAWWLGTFVAATAAVDLTAPMINSMANNSLFLRWRQTSHIIAPGGVMGDPCGFMYHPGQSLYHMFYGWHPQHVSYGNMTWGHIVSRDLITWTDVGDWRDDKSVAIAPVGQNRTYDGLGIFSGSTQPVNLQGQLDDSMTMFFTAAHYLPTSFLLPYTPGLESQNIATSRDGGITWQKHEKNPIIINPPGGWNITGFRDFFVEPMPFMDSILGQTEPHYYATFGSGIRGVGPRMPLYSAPASDLTNWTFLGALWEPHLNETLGTFFTTGTSGSNFEMTGIFPLVDDRGDVHYYANLGVEWLSEATQKGNYLSMYYEGVLSRRSNGSAEFKPISGGKADHGFVYPFASFNDTKVKRRLLIGLARDDSVTSTPKGAFSLFQQGYQNCFALIREVFVQTIRGIVNHDGLLGEVGPYTLTPETDGTFTARTLGYKPAMDVITGLRKGAREAVFTAGEFRQSRPLVSKGSLHSEFSAIITNPTGPCGFRIAVSPDGREYTTVSFNPHNNTVVVDRTYSSLISEFNSSPVEGYFRAFYIKKSDGSVAMEPIKWRIFLDGSLLEIFINDRFSLTTRIYPSLESSNGLGVYVSEGNSAFYQDLHYWSGLANVWPQRPLDSSSPLIWDSPQDTDNYKWWFGY
ncbi:glycoside hydrolase family 32 protein [Myriangium duriaei CBS 260.36]|uniref:Glycoside hydrolase family 32 protein n=1 Tax=Myriangium duriaei CBS 260.36 TaxID=1168546 RepID=A0A9P4J5Y6_9PEZI|nr:glycoside hydrolase family 32 protein [Myriangium duriaei CBS 260.36]